MLFAGNRAVADTDRIRIMNLQGRQVSIYLED